MYRNTIQLNQIRWNVNENIYNPKKLTSINNLTSNPIMRSRFLSKNKLKKFNFTITGETIYKNQPIYIINFSTDRNHSTYTNRVFLSNYSGTIYVNKNDYAIVKLIENWNVIEFPDELKELISTDWKSNFIKKEYVNESRTTEYSKINNHYFLTEAKDCVIGNLLDNNNKTHAFKETFDSNWYNFNSENPKSISSKEEETVFNKISYNKDFWNTFKL